MRAQPASSLDSVWACLDCYWKDRLAKVKMSRRGNRMARPFLCPRCFSENLHPADKDIVTLTRYEGAIGTRN
jgi:hypothetical protein